MSEKLKWHYRCYRYLSQIISNYKSEGKLNFRSHAKYFYKWITTINSGKTTYVDQEPWLPYHTIAFLTKHINQITNVFEYGGGSSTLYYLKHGKKVITVEHDPDWFHVFSKTIEEQKYSHWIGKLVLPEKGDLVQNPNPAAPLHFHSSDINYVGYNFKSYCESINQFGDETFDLIVVDGRARPSCAVVAFPKLKKGGWLLHDNTNLKHYHAVNDAYFKQNFEIIHDHVGAVPYGLDFARTTIYRKK